MMGFTCDGAACNLIPSMKRNGSKTFLTAYNPPLRDAVIWGVRVLDAGFESFPPGKPYPAREHHPDAYLYQWEKGRVFAEYQFLAITRGKGVLETASCPKLPLEAGDLFILFPGEWHRFRPDEDSGWDEVFVGFDGDYARHLMQSFFTPGCPVLRGAATSETVGLMRKIALAAEKTSSETLPLVFADMISLITRLVLFARVNAEGQYRLVRQKINTAREHILKNAFQRVDFRGLAGSLGLSYTVFRREFQRETGHSPLAYQLGLRVSRARVLLEQTDLTVSDIAQQTGFSNVFYFSKMFLKRTGQTPSACRQTAARQAGRHVRNKR